MHWGYLTLQLWNPTIECHTVRPVKRNNPAANCFKVNRCNTQLWSLAIKHQRCFCTSGFQSTKIPRTDAIKKKDFTTGPVVVIRTIQCVEIRGETRDSILRLCYQMHVLKAALSAAPYLFLEQTEGILDIKIK